MTKYLKVADIVAILKYSDGRPVRKLIKDKKIAGVEKHGMEYRIPVDSFNEYLKSRKVS